MALHKYYQGAFVSRMGHTIRCEVWQESNSDPVEVGELDFPYESPLTIEWDADSKRETIQGSTATMTVISPGDRTYLDLYTTVAGSVQLRVYRDSALFWSGTLDTEHYEEPFSREKEYDVSFTFTDFGILDRLKYEQTGKLTIHAVILNAISRSGLYQTSYIRRMSTQIGTSATTLADIWVNSDNFTDEDGETLSLKKVTEGVLQPLDLHMRQWNGVINVYDHNTAAAITPTDVTWEDDDQVLSVDEVYNTVKVTLSPYAQGELLKKDVYTSNMDVDVTLEANYTHTPTVATDGKGHTYEMLSWYVDNKKLVLCGFNLYVLKDGGEATSSWSYGVQSQGLIPAHIEAYGNGESCDFMLKYCQKNYHVKTNGSLDHYGNNNVFHDYPVSGEVYSIRSPQISIPKQPNKGQYFIRIVQPLMLSAAYNPFSTDCGYEADNVKKLTTKAGYVIVPFRLRLYNDNGAVIMHYENHEATLTNNVNYIYSGVWVDGDYNDTTGYKGKDRYAWLSYHANDDRSETNGIDNGWAENRQFVGLSIRNPNPSLKVLDTGQYCSLPPVAGRMAIEIFDDIMIYDWNNDKIFLGSVADSTKALYNMIKWIAYKAPSLDIVRYQNGKTFDLQVDDIEYLGVLDKNAKEELSIATICGTASQVLLGARGVYMDADGDQLAAFRRNGREETAEQLLIGTMHSHYATRHLKLSGTMRLDAPLQQLPIYKDTTLNVTMIATSVVANMRTDEMEATLIETNQDCYTSV